MRASQEGHTELMKLLLVAGADANVRCNRNETCLMYAVRSGSTEAVELLLNTAPGRKLAERIRPPQVSLHAPDVIDLEVAQTLRRYVRKGTISGDRGRLALEHLSMLELNRYSHDTFLDRIGALKENFTAYDAAYVALAEALDAPLVTGDIKLAKAPGIHTTIEKVG